MDPCQVHEPFNLGCVLSFPQAAWMALTANATTAPGLEEGGAGPPLAVDSAEPIANWFAF